MSIGAAAPEDGYRVGALVEFTMMPGVNLFNDLAFGQNEDDRGWTVASYGVPNTTANYCVSEPNITNPVYLNISTSEAFVADLTVSYGDSDAAGTLAVDVTPTETAIKVNMTCDVV